MPEVQDLHLHQPSAADDLEIGRDPDLIITDHPDRSKWILLVVLLGIAVGAVSYALFWRQRAVPPAATAITPTAPAAAAAAAPHTGPLVEAENIPLPPLGESDALVRQLIVKLTSHPKALAWLATNGLIDNFTVATLNISDGQTPVVHLRTLAPAARFSVTKADGGFVIDPKSYHRYDEYAAAISGLDPAGTARLYLTLKPRITESYRNLGFPEGDFDRVLERAIGALLATPAVDSNVQLREKVLSYAYTDPKLESLSPAQKQLLRMGPDNVRRVQEQLRQIATQLALHPLQD